MKSNEMLKLEKELEILKKEDSRVGKIWRENNYSNDYYLQVKEVTDKIEAKKKEIISQKHREVKVGDGITLRVYTDCHAFTVISRTEKTLTIQQDTATLKNDWKPEIIPGGFAGYCVNQEEQEYDYTPNPNGQIITLRWSNKYNRWNAPKGYGSAYLGRHEYYDYNF